MESNFLIKNHFRCQICDDGYYLHYNISKNSSSCELCPSEVAECVQST